MLTRVVVKLNWMKTSYVAVANFEVELLDIVMFVLRAYYRLKLKSVKDQSKLALYFAQARAVVNDDAQIFKVSFNLFDRDGECEVT
jgi:hypothetical protein